eukprot:3794470-Rhodomonas_salina.2
MFFEKEPQQKRKQEFPTREDAVDFDTLFENVRDPRLLRRQRVRVPPPERDLQITCICAFSTAYPRTPRAPTEYWHSPSQYRTSPRIQRAY